MRVQINYKSGRSMVMDCDEFTVRRHPLDSAIDGYGFKGAHTLPRLIDMDIDSIESVWELPDEGEQ